MERPCCSLPAPVGPDLPCRLMPVSAYQQPVSSYQVIHLAVYPEGREIREREKGDGQNEEGETVTILIADNLS